MVSTRSKTSLKHDTSKTEQELPSKKQRLSKSDQKKVKSEEDLKETVFATYSNSHKKSSETIKPVKQQEHDEKPTQKQSPDDVPTKESSDNKLHNEILETGIFYFFFRPKVNVDEPESMADVQ